MDATSNKGGPLTVMSEEPISSRQQHKYTEPCCWCSKPKGCPRAEQSLSKVCQVMPWAQQVVLWCSPWEPKPPMPFSSTVIMMGCSLAICLSSRMSKGLQNLGSRSILPVTYRQHLMVFPSKAAGRILCVQGYGPPAFSLSDFALYNPLSPLANLNGAKDAKMQTSCQRRWR